MCFYKLPNSHGNGQSLNFKYNNIETLVSLLVKKRNSNKIIELSNKLHNNNSYEKDYDD